MLHVGLDLSRKRLDFHALSDDGESKDRGAAPPDADGLRHLTRRLAAHGEPVSAAIESMNGARFVHDQLELSGWRCRSRTPRRPRDSPRSPARRTASTPGSWQSSPGATSAIWLPDPEVRAERERARFRLHLVKQRSRLKNRVHSALLAFGKPCPVADLFGRSGRGLGRFASPTRLCGYTGLCPRVYQSGDSDRRGPLSRNQPFAPAGAALSLAA
jgi:transposase